MAIDEPNKRHEAEAPLADASGAALADASGAAQADAAGAAQVGAAASEPSRDTAGSAALLTPTGRVILGMIAIGKQTGYDIKQLVDKSTRHFWAASYGQIYPELRRLEEQGLIRGRQEPSGARARTVYELTDAGHTALRGWLASDAELVDELRDEGMLKLFFSDVAPELRLKNIRAMRAQNERARSALRAIAAHETDMHTGPRLTLQLGLEMTQVIIEWCEKTERRLTATPEPEPNNEV
jgi:DNA-binding PadR family transcriptional regulator